MNMIGHDDESKYINLSLIDDVQLITTAFLMITSPLLLMIF